MAYAHTQTILRDNKKVSTVGGEDSKVYFFGTHRDIYNAVCWLSTPHHTRESSPFICTDKTLPSLHPQKKYFFTDTPGEHLIEHRGKMYQAVNNTDGPGLDMIKNVLVINNTENVDWSYGGVKRRRES